MPMCWNVRSINNKVDNTMSLAVDRDTPLLFLTETWLTDDSNSITARIKSYGYKIIHETRNCTSTGKLRGGGVAIIHKKDLNFTKVFIGGHLSTIEAVAAKIRLSSGEMLLCCCVYRTNYVSQVFFQEFDEFISSMFIKFPNILLCGDINIHLDNPYCSNARKFEDLISSFGMKQVVSMPTHKSGHTLDIVVASPKILTDDSAVVEPKIIETFPGCDHFPISFDLKKQFSFDSSEKKEITFRNLKSIDPCIFRDHLQNITKLPNDIVSSFQDTILSFNYCSKLLLDSHAPTLTKVIKERATAPWFDGEYKSLRIMRRKAEKKWLKSQTEAEVAENKENYIKLRDDCYSLALEKKKKYYQEQFENHKYSSKSLYNFVETFSDKNQELTLPPNESIQTITEEFNTFFQAKIDAIRENFKTSNYSEFCSGQKFSGVNLSEFKPTTPDEILEILKDSELKTSSVDPLPASILDDNLDILIPYLCFIVNLSLSSGSIDGAKIAHVTPLIKGENIDSSILKNYRPISNLSFIGKLIERIVLRRLNEHLETNHLNIANQSGYRKYYSTETLLVKIVDDLLIAFDENKATVVMMLDLSAAFDTVDHGKLLNILFHEIGITGTALKWFRSFITGRTQKIKIGSAESETIVIRFGVPQGSVLGPILFNLYIRSLYSSVKKLQFTIHGYADDHQIYKSFTEQNQYSVLVNEIPDCFNQIEKWMAAHFLQLNPGKTEIIVFGTPKVLSNISINGSFLKSETCIRFSPIVKNLGFRLDSHLNLNKQAGQVKSNCYNKLRIIARMKPFLNSKQITMLVQATIISSLDYCNALYLGCNSTVIQDLQNIQNRACRLIFGLKRNVSVSPYLKSLHWLKVKQRIEFKILLLVFKCIHGLAPSYLSDTLCQTHSCHSRAPSLHVPSKLNSKAFSSNGPTLWNSLPVQIRSIDNIDVFKSSIKTHLFRKCYGDE